MAPHFGYADLGTSSRSSEKTTFNFRTFERVTRFCQGCTGRYSFWCAVAAFACLEPILCSIYPTLLLQVIQAVVLGISTILYGIQLIGVATREWEKIVVIEAMTRLGTMSIRNPLKDFTALKLLVFFAAEGEYVLEGAMIVLGWILLFWRPGLATLRCFRVFRILWFYEVDVFKNTTVRILSPYFGAEFVIRGFKVLKFAINALTALGNEMFRLTNETRGALLLIMMFFYAAFVLGTTLFIETDSNSDLCQSMGQCTWTLVRLTFFDGDGLDFAYYLTDNHRILFFIVMLYLCITSFGILNGLVGVFGTALARASHLAFEDDDNQIEGLNGSLDDLDSELDQNAEIDKRARRRGGGGGEEGDGEGGDGGGEGEERRSPEAGLDKIGNGNDNEAIQSYQDGGSSPRAPPPLESMSPEMRRSAANMLRASSSRFATEHFNRAAKEANAESHGGESGSPQGGGGNREEKAAAASSRHGLSFASMFGGATNRRKLTLRDAAMAITGRPSTVSMESPSSPVHALRDDEDISPDDSEEGHRPYHSAAVMPAPGHAFGGGHGASRLAVRLKPSAGPASFANMFAVGGNGANRALPAKSSRNLLAAHGSAIGGGGGGGHASAASLHTDMRSLLNQMSVMQQVLEQQTCLISQLNKQVGQLSKQLDAVSPISRDVDDISVVSATAASAAHHSPEDSHYHLTSSGGILPPGPSTGATAAATASSTSRSAAHPTTHGIGSFFSRIGQKRPSHPDSVEHGQLSQTPLGVVHEDGHIQPPRSSSPGSSLATLEPAVHRSVNNTPRRGGPAPEPRGEAGQEGDQSVGHYGQTTGRFSSPMQSTATPSSTDHSLFRAEAIEALLAEDDQIQRFDG